LNGRRDSSFASPTLQTGTVADGSVAQSTTTVVERSPAPTKLITYQPQHALPPLTVNFLAPSQVMIALVGSILAAAELGITNGILVQNDIATKGTDSNYTIPLW
jgi:hypothetical protein